MPRAAGPGSAAAECGGARAKLLLIGATIGLTGLVVPIALGGRSSSSPVVSEPFRCIIPLAPEGDPMRAAILLLACVALAGLTALAGTDAPVTALRGLDPVELSAGREVPGKAGISAVHGTYRYLFASEQNRRLFLSSGEQYAIRYGGACARMGPFSGKGDPDRFLVHDGWIFIFASDACRERFKSTPQKFLERADRLPTGTPEEAKRAAALMEKAIAGVGGAQRLGEVADVTERRRITLDAGGKPYSYDQTVLLGFPESIRVLEQHGPSTYGWALEPEGGTRIDADEVTPADRSVTEIMRREYYRHPLALLKAWERGAAIGYARGRGTSARTDVERVAVHVAGATTTLGIEPASGRIVEVAYRGWLADGMRAFYAGA